MPWQVDSVELPNAWVSEATYTALTLQTRVTKAERDQLRIYAEQAGKFERIQKHDGSYTVEPHAYADIAVDLTVDSGQKPPWRDGTYYVLRYDERPTSPAEAHYDIELSLARDAARESGSHTPSETRAADEWLFSFSDGDVAATAAHRPSVGQSDEVEITTEWTPDQLPGLLDSASYQGSVQVQSVPGGDDYPVDHTAGARNTVDITVADGLDVAGSNYPDGRYVVLDWRVRQLAPERYAVSMTARPAAILHVASSDTYTIASGDSERYGSVDVDGTLDVQGTLDIAA